MTPEQLELAIKLDSIFMPHAKKQRDEAHKKQTSSTEPPSSGAILRCVHYTSAEATLNIIKEKRIWMRNTNCMSDYNEVQHGFEILRTFFTDKSKVDQFTTALDVCALGAATEAIGVFDKWWTDTKLNTYIASISEHDDKEDLHGRLSMWRAFGGNNTARVAFVFGVPWFSGASSELNIMFSPVAYLTKEEVHAFIYDVIKNIDDNRDFLSRIDRSILVSCVFNMLLASVTCLKHEGFREEREWRVIYSPNRRPSRWVEASTQVIAGVPQPVYKLPLDATVAPFLADLDFAQIFDRLIIGPSPYPWPMYEAFKAALTEAGVKDAQERVFVSDIPIRA